MMKEVDPEIASRFVRELDWNLLRTFVVIAESDNITHAAQTLNLRQPSVSAALKRLEQVVGKQLVVRNPNEFRLTDTGQLLYREALDIRGSILRLGTILRDVEDKIRGHVTLAMASHVISPIINEVLTEFYEMCPEASISIDIMASKLVQAKVYEQSVSFGVCLVRNQNPKMKYQRLFREYFGLFCGQTHPLFGKQNLTKGDLRGYTSVSFVTDQMNDALRPVTLMRAEAELSDRVFGTSAHLEEIRRMIVSGLGVGPLPLHVARADVDSGILWRLPPYDDPPAIDVTLAWNPNARKNRAEMIVHELFLKKVASMPFSERDYFV
ncbi:LysR family transcriptional regulator [Granulosicoccus antarcticus]|uniref:HTH-type transcriptional regulator CysL n=1 Tax=Granulosicoccus antarcticus IMCC3135 TaxID=1192854 RepID=A0A2Z2NRX1_9GAMM|nr:LysR family transcriptional regulator [Granulosicoccus antarcticus]ASJ74212.1 HTH-type transcriptional regulator CysL [Granulosicoccus antarcticus IMCC3135]